MTSVASPVALLDRTPYLAYDSDGETISIVHRSGEHFRVSAETGERQGESTRLDTIGIDCDVLGDEVLIVGSIKTRIIQRIHGNELLSFELSPDNDGSAVFTGDGEGILATAQRGWAQSIGATPRAGTMEARRDTRRAAVVVRKGFATWKRDLDRLALVREVRAWMEVQEGISSSVRNRAHSLLDGTTDAIETMSEVAWRRRRT